jgi:hypothetical protein
MRIEFDEVTDLPPEEVYEYFRSPHGWPELFTAFGRSIEGNDGWVHVPLRRSPFVLRAKVTSAEPYRRVAWTLRGFWSGSGEVRLLDLQDGTRVTGFENVSPPRILCWGGLLERGAEPRFGAVRESGWRRIRRGIIIPEQS